MTRIKMNMYGAVLTGRAFGKEVYERIFAGLNKQLVILDFEGVFSLGSSFGEEIVVPIAKLQQSQVTVVSAAPAVRDCLEQIEKDYKIKINFTTLGDQ
jgi:hypothetical protein